MANHYGSYFYLRHADKAEIDRLRDAIKNQTEIAEIWDIQFKTICVEYVEILEYDENNPNRIVLKFEFRRYLPFALFETLEQSGFKILAHIYDLCGDAWVYANDEMIEVPNWLHVARLEDLLDPAGEATPDSLEARLEQRKEQIEERRRTYFFDLNPSSDTRRIWPDFPRVPVDHLIPSEEEIRERWSRKDSEDEAEANLKLFLKTCAIDEEQGR